MHKETKGLLYGVLAAFCNALIAVFIKLSTDIPNEVMVFFRFLMGFLILLPIYIGGKILPAKVPVYKHIFRTLVGLTSLYFYYYGLERLPVANAISLANTMPLFTPFVVLVWLRLLVSKWRFVSAAIGFMGVLLMLNPSNFTFELASFAALSTGLCGAIAFVGVRQMSKVESIGVLVFYYFAFATILSFYPCIRAWTPIDEPKLWIYLICMGVLGVLFQYFLTRAFSMAPASKAGLTVYLAIVFGGFLGWLIWGEVPTFWVAVGMILTVAGGVVSIFDQTEPKKISWKFFK